VRADHWLATATATPNIEVRCYSSVGGRAMERPKALIRQFGIPLRWCGLITACILDARGWWFAAPASEDIPIPNRWEFLLHFTGRVIALVPMAVFD